MDTFDQSGKREFFRRQRRNLIAASIVTALYGSAELSFPELNIFGNKVQIDNPKVVTFAIIVAFIYFLWRYYTACREIDGVSQFFGACQMWATDRARLYVIRKHVVPNDDKYRSAELIKGGREELTFRLRRQDDGLPEETVKVRERYWLYQLVSFVPTSLNTSNFTEYLLPFALSAIAVFELLEFELIEQVIIFLQLN